MYLLGVLCVGISYTCWEFYRVYNNQPSLFHIIICFLFDEPDISPPSIKPHKENTIPIPQPPLELTKRNPPHVDTRLSTDEEQLFKLI